MAYRKLGRESRIRRSILAGLTKDVINHGYVVTTEARAKEARKFVDKMVTYGKKGTLISRRQALAFLHNDKDVVNKVFNELAPKYADRNGGYTRIIKTGFRLNDAAETCFIELVDYNENLKKNDAPKKATRTRRSSKKKVEAAAATDNAAEAPVEEASAE